MRAIARDPDGAATRVRLELLPNVRSMHIRHARGASGVKEPVHVIFFDTKTTSSTSRVYSTNEWKPTLSIGSRKPKRR